MSLLFLASLPWQAVLAVKEQFKLPIVALDIAGPEEGYPAEAHIDAYK
jgi:hypothetical protein